METKHIQEFLALAEFESSYVAAEKLFVSQSTLVRHIQAIEEEFGTPLFNRSKRGFTLNPAGQIFVNYARKMAMEQEECYRRLHGADGGPNLIRLCAQGNIIDLLVDFKRAYPDYIIDYRENEGLMDKLRTGKVEIAFLSNVLPFPEDLVTVPYYREEVMVLLYENHPLANRDSVTLEDIRKERFITLSADTVFDRSFLEMFGKIGFVQDVAASVPDGGDMIKMVQEELGIAIIHGLEETTPEYPGLKCIPLEPRMQYEVMMCYLRDMPMSRAAQEFIDFSKKWIITHKSPNLSLFR